MKEKLKRDKDSDPQCTASSTGLTVEAMKKGDIAKMISESVMR
jgi:hypothetical protein